MKILILEDNDVQADLLSKVLKNNFENADITICDNIEYAKKVTRYSKFDLYLLDVEIKDGNSIDFAELLTEEDDSYCKRIIFITAHKKYAISAINRTHCYGYIEKPYDESELIGIINSCMDCQTKSSDCMNFFDFKIRGISHFVNKDHILYIEFKNKKPVLYTYNDVFLLPRTTVKQILDKLKDDKKNIFTQCRRDTIVNQKHISHIKKEKSINYIVVNNGVTLPIGEKFKDNLFSRLRI